jgi:hypothetical protein
LRLLFSWDGFARCLVRLGWWLTDREAEDGGHGERDRGHLPEEVETAVQGEGSGRGHGACPQRAVRRAGSCPPQQPPGRD